MLYPPSAMSNRRLSSGRWPNEKGRPTNRPPFVQKFVIVPRASPEVHVRRRRGRVRCRTSPPEHSCAFRRRGKGTTARPDFFRPRWLGPARQCFHRRGVPVTGLPPSPRLLPVVGGGGVPRGCVRFNVRPTDGPGPKFPRPQACHPTSPARPALSPAEATRGARFEQSRAALTQARPRRLS